MKNHCYFNGRITTIEKIKISPYDIGLLRGYGVFDVMMGLGEKPFLLREHFARLKNSARELKLKLPFTEKEYNEILKKLLRLHKYQRSTIRTILTGGISADAFSIGQPTVYILIEKFQDYSREIYTRGAGLITLEHARHCPQAKITNYMEAIRNQDAKKKKKALEILFIKNGKVLEASTSNVFMVKDGKIITTKEGILLGITRKLVIKLAKKKFAVEEKEIKFSELNQADEVFLTATNKFIVPIVKIDKRKVGNGQPGEVTKILMQELDEFVRKY